MSDYLPDVYRKQAGTVMSPGLQAAEMAVISGFQMVREGLVKAVVALAHIRDSGLYMEETDGNGDPVYAHFQDYMSAFIRRITEIHSGMSLSEGYVQGLLRRHRRFVQAGGLPEDILNLPPAALKELEEMARFDRTTGEVLALAEGLNTQAMPASDEGDDVQTIWSRLAQTALDNADAGGPRAAIAFAKSVTGKPNVVFCYSGDRCVGVVVQYHRDHQPPFEKYAWDVTWPAVAEREFFERLRVSVPRYLLQEGEE